MFLVKAGYSSGVNKVMAGHTCINYRKIRGSRNQSRKIMCVRAGRTMRIRCEIIYVDALRVTVCLDLAVDSSSRQSETNGGRAAKWSQVAYRRHVVEYVSSRKTYDPECESKAWLRSLWVNMVVCCRFSVSVSLPHTIEASIRRKSKETNIFIKILVVASSLWFY